MSNNTILKNKTGDWLLKKQEDRLKRILIPKVPLWLETYHLTWLTLVWSLLVLVCFYLGLENQGYLWLVSVLVVLQYLTDLLDGAIGRSRNTGLVTWGYYVDHFLDFIFMTSLIFGYAIILGLNMWLFFLYVIASSFMVSTFLLVSANATFRISFLRIGPTEGRVVFIIFHSVLVYMGIHILHVLLPYITISAAISLTILFLVNQNTLWKRDLSAKQAL